MTHEQFIRWLEWRANNGATVSAYEVRHHLREHGLLELPVAPRMMGGYQPQLSSDPVDRDLPSGAAAQSAVYRPSPPAPPPEVAQPQPAPSELELAWQALETFRGRWHLTIQSTEPGEVFGRAGNPKTKDLVGTIQPDLLPFLRELAAKLKAHEEGHA